MQLRFEAGGVGSELELQPGTWTVGGGPEDGVRFPGLPPALVTLEVEPERIWLRCAEPRRVGKAMLAPGIRRWLLPGERVRLSRQAQLWVEPTPERPATAAVLRSLLAPGAAVDGSAAAALICVAGPDAGTVFPLAGSAPELGRLPGCSVRLGDGAVSRRHLGFVRQSGAHRVVDLGGRNRARWNGRRLHSGTLLSAGDVLAVGRSLLHYRPEAAGER